VGGRGRLPPPRQQAADGARRQGQRAGDLRGTKAGAVAVEDLLTQTRWGGGRHRQIPGSNGAGGRRSARAVALSAITTAANLSGAKTRPTFVARDILAALHIPY